MNYSTPMMQQYAHIKSAYPDCILFFRLGDFYEMFEQDAVVGAQILELTLTARPEGKDGRIPMCGVPYHAVDNYLNRLVRAGHKVAICEQIGPIPKSGIVTREVIRVVTPGTILDEKSLDRRQHNYLAAFTKEGQQYALAAVDISTGICKVGSWEINKALNILGAELHKLHPSECLVSDNLYQDATFLTFLKQQGYTNIVRRENWPAGKTAFLKVKQHFQLHTLDSIGLSQESGSTACIAALLDYLDYTQKSIPRNLHKVQRIDHGSHLQMDKSTILNLELFTTIRSHEQRGTLIHVLDQTMTAMGARLLRDWLSHPLQQQDEIEKRLSTVSIYYKDPLLCDQLRQTLKQIIDIERLIARLSMQLGNARDLVNLSHSLTKVILLQKQLNLEKSELQVLTQIIQLIESTFLDEPGLDIKNANMIRDGVDVELDELHHIVSDSKSWMQSLEQTERQSTGISTLKIKYNQVFGFYIEVSRGQLEKVPANYIRKQTLVNGERFITQELKEREEIFLHAQEKMYAKEYEIFSQTIDQIIKHLSTLQDTANQVAQLDCLTNFAHIAVVHRYVCPTINTRSELSIHKGRHPVVEQLLETGTFVPNDTLMQSETDRVSLHLLTGPNMAGKSVYMRQVALILLLAHIGCFVPAAAANLPLTDRIFVRSGASDVITSGLSTFMVEMVETAYILQYATSRSLVIMDEIGRGTSTFDGIAIAWAVAEHLIGALSLRAQRDNDETSNNSNPKVLFATHYHELQELEVKYPEFIKNFHMSVDMHQGEPIFLHTLEEGPASHSYGIAVAQKAGLPSLVIHRSLELFKQFETNHQLQENRQPTDRTNLTSHDHQSSNYQHILHTLSNLDLNQTTPLQALNFLELLKKKI